MISLCDLLAEPDFKSCADVDTPSGNLDSQVLPSDTPSGNLIISANDDTASVNLDLRVLSSSVARVDVSAMNITDVSAITAVEGSSSGPTYRCSECNFVCKNSSGLLKHKVNTSTK